MPDNNVTGVQQGTDGYLWVATLGGLVRFDGAHFEEFSTIHLPKVPSLNVRKIFLDKSGQLWLAMDRGALIRAGQTAARVFDIVDGLPGARVTTISEDSEGRVCLVVGSEICRVHNEKIARIGLEEGLPAGGSSWLAADARGQLWFARGPQVGVYRAGRWQTLLALDSYPVRFVAARAGGMWICTATQLLRYVEGGEPQAVARLPSQASVRVMLEDRTGALWIGTAAGGLLHLRDNELEPVSVSHPEISALTEDREGNLWVGTTGGGLNLLRPRTMNVITTKSGLSVESVRSVCQDAEGQLWVALQDGSLMRGGAGKWQAITSAEGWPGGGAQCVAPDPTGGVWIGTHDRGLQRLHQSKVQEWGRNEGLGSYNVRSLLVTASGHVWTATDMPSRVQVLKDGKIHGYQLNARARTIRALAENIDGTVWAGTSDGQILRVQGDALVNETGAEPRTASFSVRCLHTTMDGSLWIGYAGWGVGRWHNGHYARITTANGLHDDFISQMLTDGLGSLWLTGNRGLFRVRLEELIHVAEGKSEHVRSIACGRTEGLPSLQPHCENTPVAWRGKNSELLFATRNGVLTVRASEIRDNPIPPAVFLKSVKVDDHPVAELDSGFPLRNPGESKATDLRGPNVELQLPPRHDKIEVTFTAPSFNSPENVHFRHRLNGFDSEWIEAGTARTVKYPRLPAGRYEFEVTACNEAGVWNETGSRLPWVVQPFYWQTWWFRTLLLATFTTGVITAVRYMSFRRLRREMVLLEQQALLDKERARIAKDLHDDLGASMTQLTLLLELAKQHRSEPEAVLDRLEDSLRAGREGIKSLDAAVWAINPANNTLPELVAYIGQFAMEFMQQANIHCLLDLPDHPLERPASAELRHNLFLIVKEALNNIVRHAGASEVRLQIVDHP